MRIHRRRVLVIALLAVAVAAPAQAAFPGKNGRLVTFAGSDVSVVDADPDTTDSQVIVPDAYDGRWSPDGTRILVTIAANGPTKDQVAVVKPDGTGLRVLTTTTDQASARADWSPDATRIVFDQYNETATGEYLVVMNSDGSDVHAITSLVVGAYDYSAVWSPDGRTIAFTADDGAGNTDIELVNPDGTNRRDFAATGFSEDYAAWSPDSTRIAYGVDSDVYVKALAGGSPVLVANAASKPEWSPDGTWIIYTATRTLTAGPGTQGVFARRADGTGGEVLISAEPAESVSWQPRCNLKGNAKANTLTGTSKGELICGFGGADTIDGKGGNDIVFAGGGDDRVKGGPGRDVLVGQQGNDRLDGGTGKDRCVQGPGSGALTSC